MKKTYEQAFDFLREASVFAKSNPDSLLTVKIQDLIGNQTLRKTGSMKQIVEDYAFELEKNRLNFASTDDKKNLLKDEKGELVYTAQNKLNLLLENRKLLLKEVEITPSILEDYSGIELTETQKVVFSDFVIPTYTPEPVKVAGPYKDDKKD